LDSYGAERCMPDHWWFDIGVSGNGNDTLGILLWGGSGFVWTFPASLIKYLIIQSIQVLHRFLACGKQTSPILTESSRFSLSCADEYKAGCIMSCSYH
jgi:hypothetical protein